MDRKTEERILNILDANNTTGLILDVHTLWHALPEREIYAKKSEVSDLYRYWRRRIAEDWEENIKAQINKKPDIYSIEKLFKGGDSIV